MKSTRRTTAVRTIIFLGGLCLAALAGGLPGASAAEIRSEEDTATLRAGILRRTLKLDGVNLATSSFLVDGKSILGEGGDEFGVTVRRAKPDREPKGLEPGNEKHSWSEVDFASTLLEGGEDPAAKKQDVRWVDARRVKAAHWDEYFDRVSGRTLSPSDGASRLVIRARSTGGKLKGLECSIIYEVYDGHSAVRKWIRIANRGEHWLKIDHLDIEEIDLRKKFRSRTKLTPSEGQIASSVVALGAEDGSRGLIAGSEIPSALRRGVGKGGSLGYRNELFEWVLGPGETFTSEPVFYYAYSGTTRKTPSGVSTARDRTVEGPYMDFLREDVGLLAAGKPVYAPQWASWSNFRTDINGEILREQADVAARCGFRQFSIDLGWQKYCGMEVDREKFPHLEQTTRYIRSKGMKLGMWASCYRKEGSRDLQFLPNAACVPLRAKGDIGYNSLGMSFCSPWRRYYAQGLIRLHETYGAQYFKQDFSNIKFGDIARGHESRTRKESLLRGFRGLFRVQDMVMRSTAGVHTEISHEIYWGTPGAPADIAVIKNVVQYHVSPNDYSGAINNGKPYNPDWGMDPEKHRDRLIRGCSNARKRYYRHRGLPLRCIEYYGAATLNHRGSLTTRIQDRQVCSWLMGAPMVFAGDLTSLTDENISHYRHRFRLLDRLQEEYGIYHHFQYSGVPAPTDETWHWWGKLNDEGHGAVVVLRGSEGPESRSINIPWVEPDERYRVTACFAGRDLGTFTGRELREGDISLSLPSYGQEILEVASP